jgi:hypothetical protein
LRRGGAFGYNKKQVLLMYLTAPHHLIPRRVLPPARLVQKREQGHVLHPAHCGLKARGRGGRLSADL